MDFYFLSASVPFAKTITPDTVIPYPNIGVVTSHHETAETLEGLYKLVKTHAQQGHCLLKGKLKQPLQNESRAGTTEPDTLTDWIVFDIDGLSVNSAEEFVASLPEPFHSTSYIEQLSSTAYLNDNRYKAHLFFLIKPTTPRTIKNFILLLNLQAFDLNVRLGLGNLCLNYPLDTQVNSNSTPLYIAPPTFVDRTDPLDERIFLRMKENERASIPEINLAAIKNLQQRKLLQLRHDVGLRGKQPKISVRGTLELLDNIEPMDTPRTRTERGFVYLALNPNNPFSYYHPVDNPNVIYNFRGEPAFLTRKGLPEYWELVRPKQLQPVETGSATKIPLIFRDRKRDLYYNGYKTDEGFDLSPVRSLQRIAHFATNNNIDIPDVIPDWDIVFDPTSIEPFDLNRPKINLFVPPPLLQHCIDTNPDQTTVPKTIETILRSITGSDESCYKHFLHWLAFIFQTRKKTGTAWVFQGVEGTGKGLLYTHILKPLFGEEHCHEKTIKHLTDNFNGWLERCILLFVDESRIYGRAKQEQIPNLLKNLITESEQTLRLMHSNPFQTKNYSNLIFATNDGDALEISASDRRYNVCPDQLEPFRASPDIAEILTMEIPQFAEFLWAYPTDEKTARTALSNMAKMAMHESRLDDIGMFSRYLLTGNFLPFYDTYVDTVGTAPEHGIYKSIISSWVKRHRESANNTIRIKKDELRFVYNYRSEKEISQSAFGRLMKRNRIEFQQANDAERARYTTVEWKIGLDELKSFKLV